MGGVGGRGRLGVPGGPGGSVLVGRGRRCGPVLLAGGLRPGVGLLRGGLLLDALGAEGRGVGRLLHGLGGGVGGLLPGGGRVGAPGWRGVRGGGGGTLGLGADQAELDAAVGLAARLGLVGGDGVGLAEAPRLEARHGDALGAQRGQHRLGAALAQLQVRGLAALAVGIARDPQPQVGAGPQDLGDGLDDRLALRGDGVGARLEGDLGGVGDGGDLGQALLRRGQRGQGVERLDIGDLDLQVGVGAERLDGAGGDLVAGGGVAGAAGDDDGVGRHGDGAVGEAREGLDAGQDAHRPAGGKAPGARPGRHGHVLRAEAGLGEGAGEVAHARVLDAASQAHLAVLGEGGAELGRALGRVRRVGHRTPRVESEDVGQRPVELGRDAVEERGVGGGRHDQRHVGVGHGQGPGAEVVQGRDPLGGRLAPVGRGGAEAQAAVERPLGPGGERRGEDGVAGLLRIGGAGVEGKLAVLDPGAQREGGDHRKGGGDREGEAQSLRGHAGELGFQAALVLGRIGDRLDGDAARGDRDLGAGQGLQGVHRVVERGLPAIRHRVVGDLEEVRDLLALRGLADLLDHLVAVGVGGDEADQGDAGVVPEHLQREVGRVDGRGVGHAHVVDDPGPVHDLGGRGNGVEALGLGGGLALEDDLEAVAQHRGPAEAVDLQPGRHRLDRAVLHHAGDGLAGRDREPAGAEERQGGEKRRRELHGRIFGNCGAWATAAS
ncbi:hypothetical protein Rumeso_02812 [Rubellimicrobium mesophilum DSM 19309]|uniref:Uncharacterized protein n=1 Tax=Rubellimicrobium mesophilum DSM 19309 TaxID=442562 RepID=A0A017HN29_9RHOB|nr:hypothetical protein Rumeso_02812 [Rubellimicrobium mesophilum DSM 19309]